MLLSETIVQTVIFLVRVAEVCVASSLCMLFEFRRTVWFSGLIIIIIILKFFYMKVLFFLTITRRIELWLMIVSKFSFAGGK
jgi:hypothetical protein